MEVMCNLIFIFIRIDYNHTAVESFLLSGIGILIFIGFGADVNIYIHWFKISIEILLLLELQHV